MVFNPHDDDASQRYRTIVWRGLPDGNTNHVMTSPDGIRWTVDERKPTFGDTDMCGDVIMTHYNPKTRQYVASVRHTAMPEIQINPRIPEGRAFLAFIPYAPLNFAGAAKRRVWQIESGDFIHWTEPHLILNAEDGFDNIDDAFYGMAQYPLDSLLLGFLNVFHQTPNTLDVQLVYTRDGYNWHRLNKGHPFLPLGEPGSWEGCMVNIPAVPVTVGDELYVYYGASKNHHDWWMSGQLEGLDVPESHDESLVGYYLGLAKMRFDGFVSIDGSMASKGIMVTRPLISDGQKLVINAKVEPGGHIAVEATDGDDNVLEGCDRAAHDTFRGDDVRHVVTWGGSSLVPKHHYRKLRFFLHKASIYSLQLADPKVDPKQQRVTGMGWDMGDAPASAQ